MSRTRSASIALRLADLADGVDEARLVEEMNAFDPDGAAASLTELERRDEELGLEEKERYAERDRLQRKREEFESSIGAEAALQQRRNAEAELVDAARRWAVLKAASALLGGALDAPSRDAPRPADDARRGSVRDLDRGRLFRARPEFLRR